MNPTELLKNEHKLIQAVVRTAALEAESIRKSRAVPVARIEKILEFFQIYVNRCHHVKEEEHLFPMLGRHGITGDTGLVSQLVHDHEACRHALDSVAWELASPQEAAAAETIGFNLAGYARVLGPHCDREDTILFPQVRALLPTDEQERLVKAFAEVEAHALGSPGRGKYESLARELAGAPAT